MNRLRWISKTIHYVEHGEVYGAKGVKATRQVKTLHEFYGGSWHEVPVYDDADIIKDKDNE